MDLPEEVDGIGQNRLRVLISLLCTTLIIIVPIAIMCVR